MNEPEQEPAATPGPEAGPGPAVAASDAAPAAPGSPGGDRQADLVLARLHLRVGLLGLARVELETLAGTAELDLAGILDLAEVRWRTGDLRGAGEAAAAYLALAARAGLEPDGPLAHAIVAEAAALRGHDAEAAEAVAGALAILRAGLDDPAALEPALDRLFAGITPRGPWPEPEGAGMVTSPGPRRLPWELPPPGPSAEPELPPASEPAEADLLVAGRGALAAADPGRAAVALGLALRSDPASAPAVVAAVEEAGTLAGHGGGAVPAPDPGLASLAVVQGDALRAAGRDDEATLAYDLARQLAASVGETEDRPDAGTDPAAEDGGGGQTAGGSP